MSSLAYSRIRCLLLCSFVAAALATIPASATAAEPAVAWKVQQTATPTHLEPGSSTPSPGPAEQAHPKLRVNVANVGGATAQNVTVTDFLPADLFAQTGIEPSWKVLNPKSPESSSEPSEINGTCEVAGHLITCTIGPDVVPGVTVQVLIGLEVAPVGAETVTNQVTVEAGGEVAAKREVPVEISNTRAPFGFAPPAEESLGASAYNEAGRTPQAGEHPFSVELVTKISSVLFGSGSPYLEERPAEALRDLELSLPSGLVVNPRAAPVRCSKSSFESQAVEGLCPSESQVGVVYFDLLGVAEGVKEPLYVMVPEPGVPAELGFSLQGNAVFIRAGLSGAFQLTSSATELLSRFPLDGVRVELWGIPSDSRHDRLRVSSLNQTPGQGCRNGCSSPPSPRPFITMPSSCGSALDFEARATSWSGSEDERTEQFRTPSGELEDVDGCNELPFAPRVSVESTTRSTDAPSGLGFDLKVPQNESLTGLASATVKKVTLTLPSGVAVNPPAANGLAACAAEEIGLGDNSPAECPNGSKVGSAEVLTPLLEAPLKGSIYLAEQKNNPFGTLLALYLAVEGEGVVIKLPGRVEVDPQSGRVTTTFDDNPQLPFEELKVDLNSGPRAALVTPASCGIYSVRTELTSWASDAPVVLTTPMTVDQGCANGGFKPGLEAGSTNPVAGKYSAFNLRVTRGDGEQNLARVSATLPEGLLAKLAGVPLCPDVWASVGDCTSASQVGTTVTGVGAGALPLYLPQAGKAKTVVYLAGPYEGAPYSLVVKVPAQAGPFDLGTIAVRAALNVDPFTAQVTARSDSLPQILEGIPVEYREVRVEVNRPEFVRNPTNCEPMQVTSSLVSSSGSSASPSSRFQVADCSSLAFKPTLKLSLTGSTKRVGHPGLKAVLTYPKQGSFANIARAQVNLPGSEFLDQGNLNKTCTKPVLVAGDCPKTAIYGKAKAWTPLLEKPLEGPVYLVGGFGYKLPALVADLDGQLRVLLAGKVDSGPNKGIRNTFEAVPDAPVSRFVLELKGGKKYSLLENSENLCQKTQRAIARFTGQNGAVEVLRPLISNQCGKKRKSNAKK